MPLGGRLEPQVTLLPCRSQVGPKMKGVYMNNIVDEEVLLEDDTAPAASVKMTDDGEILGSIENE